MIKESTIKNNDTGESWTVREYDDSKPALKPKPTMDYTKEVNRLYAKYEKEEQIKRPNRKVIIPKNEPSLPILTSPLSRIKRESFINNMGHRLIKGLVRSLVEKR